MGIKEVGRFIYGDWATDLGKDYSKNLADRAGIHNDSKSIFKKETWNKQTLKNAKENFLKLKEHYRSEPDFWNKQLAESKKSYKHVTSKEFKEAQEATKAATKAAKTSKGFFGRMFENINKKILKPISDIIIKKVPGGAKAIKYLGKVGKIFKKIPILGTALMTIGEIPNIFNAFAKGGFAEGVKQIGRSAINLAGDLTAFAVGSAAGTAIAGVIGQILCPIPGLGFVLGAAIGIGLSSLTRKVTEPVANGVFGESKVEQQEKAQEEAQEQLRKQAQSTQSPFSYTNTGSSQLNQPIMNDYLSSVYGSPQELMNPYFNPYLTQATNYST